MKKIFLLFSLLIASNELLQAQGWQELGTGGHALNANNVVVTMCADTGGVVYVAGSFTDSETITAGKEYVIKWDPISGEWSRLGNDTAFYSFGEISSICVDGGHNLYAGVTISGNIGLAGEVIRWNGISWSELGTGINALNANSGIRSICTDPAGNVYVAGDFTDSVSVLKGHNYVAKWDGSAWSEMGTGSNALNVNQTIRSIISDYAGNIYAAGDFFIPGSISLPGDHYYVAKWDGATWSQLGAGSKMLNANNSIWSLAADATGNIYAAGWFEIAHLNFYVAKWNGTTWSELGTGDSALNANDGILSITTDLAGNVYAAGGFTDTNNSTYVAKWNHGTGVWSELGTGSGKLSANGEIFTICTNTTGNIYAGKFCDEITDPTCQLNNVAEYKYANTEIIPLSSTAKDIIIYPNPSNNMIHVINADQGHYKLLDVYGKVVLYGKSTSENTSIDISGLSSGVYVFLLDNVPGRFLKIVKE